MRELVRRELEESASIKRLLAENMADTIVEAARIIINAFKADKKVLLIGNGGCAAYAQPIPGELYGSFKKQKDPMPAPAPTTHNPGFTAPAKDYGYDKGVRRQN